jgi:hypothetical protein
MPKSIPSMTGMCTSAHQRHGKNAHARLLVHLALLECDTGGLVSLSLAALYALWCGRGRVVELLEGERERAAGVIRVMTGTCTSGIDDTGNMLMPDSSYTSHFSSATQWPCELVSPAALYARTWWELD